MKEVLKHAYSKNLYAHNLSERISGCIYSKFYSTGITTMGYVSKRALLTETYFSVLSVSTTTPIPMTEEQPQRPLCFTPSSFHAPLLWVDSL